jgi:hypothetical protein
MGPGNTEPWDSSKSQASALFVGVPPGDQALLKSANLKGRRSSGIAYILHTYGPACTPADVQARDSLGDLETLVRHIKDEL